jgi:hypothetical protein
MDRVQSDESYLDCHIHVDALVSRTIQPESGGYSCDKLPITNGPGPVCMCE